MVVLLSELFCIASNNNQIMRLSVYFPMKNESTIYVTTSLAMKLYRCKCSNMTEHVANQADKKLCVRA